MIFCFQVIHLLMWLAAHIMLPQKFWKSVTVLKQMFGVRELSFTFFWVEYLLFGLVRSFEHRHFDLCSCKFIPIFFWLLIPLSSCAYYGCVESEQGIFEQVLRGDLDFVSDPWPAISESAKDLVRKMLVRDPKRRMTAHQVLCNMTLLIDFQSFFFLLFWNDKY